MYYGRGEGGGCAQYCAVDGPKRGEFEGCVRGVARGEGVEVGMVGCQTRSSSEGGREGKGWWGVFLWGLVVGTIGLL